MAAMKAPLADQGPAQAVEREHGESGGYERGQPIGDDIVPAPRPEQFAGGDLEPIDAYGPEGEVLALEAGIDQGALFQHPLRGQHVDDLGAVHRGQQHDAGQIGDERQCDQSKRGKAWMERETIEHLQRATLHAFQG